MVTQSGIEMGHTKVMGWDTPRSVVVTQSDIEMGQGLHTKVSGGHSEWYRDGIGAPHQGQ